MDDTLQDSSSSEESEGSSVVDESLDTTENKPKSRSAEGRLSEVLAENQKIKAKLDELEQQIVPPPPPSPDTNMVMTPETERVVSYMKSLGFVTQAEQKAAVQAVQDRALLDNEHARLENTYSGDDGRPRYDRSAVEDLMRTRGLYDPSVAYKELHEAELLDWELKRLEKSEKKRPYVEKAGDSGATRGENTITRERIAEAMKTPEGRLWYERNRDKILTLTQQGQL